MADTFTSRLRFRLQETGANRDTWGGLLNSDTLNLIEKAVAGAVDITIAGVDVTLTTNNGAEDQSRYAFLNLIGSPGAARNLIIPQVSKSYIIRNNTGSTITVTTDTGNDDVDLADGVCTLVVTDGADVLSVQPEFPNQAADSAALGGIPAAQWARLDASQDFDGGQGNIPSALSMGASVTPNFDLANVFTGVLTADTTLQTPSNLPAAGAQWFYVHLQQATGSGPWDISFSAFYDFLGATPTMPQDDGQSLVIRGLYLPGYGKAICDVITEVAAGTLDLTLSVNEANIDVFRRAGSPAGVVTLNMTIAAGVVIRSTSALEPALDFGGGFASGSVINLVNLGYVIGRGGRGSDGGWLHDSGDADGAKGSGAAEAGGNAINGPGAGNTLNITNAGGRIWGGGGGGGAGGPSSNDGGIAATGGGGGGAGEGQGGFGASGKRRGNVDQVSATNGANGRLGLDGSAAGGAAGTGAAASAATDGASGAGGDYGAAGTSGTSNTTGTSLQLGATAGGAAGKAVEVNSATVVFVNGSGSPNVKGAVS